MSLVRVPRTLPKILSPEEVQALLGALATKRDRAMVLAIMVGGLRRCEVLGLRLEALFLGWCAGDGVQWQTIDLSSLARFKHWLEATPVRSGRLRKGGTVDAVLIAVCEFLRFCARTGLIDDAVADRLAEPRFLRFLPPGFDAGEGGRFRTVRARQVRARAETAFPELRRSAPSSPR